MKLYGSIATWFRSFKIKGNAQVVLYSKTNLQNLLASLLIYVLTFPAIEIDFSVGLDSSYFWALNHLFAKDYSTLRQIVFPLGPLGFLKGPSPIGLNVELFLVFFSIIKIWFTYLFITLSAHFSGRRSISYIVVVIMLLFLAIDYLILGVTSILCFHFLKHGKSSYLATSTFIAIIGLCIKTSIGFSSLSVVFMAILLQLYKDKNYKSILPLIIPTLTAALGAGLLVFHNLELFIKYISNCLRFIFGYSSALAIFPSNNWFLLAIVLITTLLPLTLKKERYNTTILLILLPSLFAAWKHSISRQDYLHGSEFLGFLFLYWGLFMATSKLSLRKLAYLSTISISFYYLNFQNVNDFRPKLVEFNGIINFEKTVLHFNEFKRKYKEKSSKNVQRNQLSQEVISIIGSKTVDSFPWELSYFSANPSLNWKPRKTLQSGSYATWLDILNAESFNRTNGPEFLIFHYSSDAWAGSLGSVDQKYLLNDCPYTIFEIFNNYSIRLKAENFLLLKKNQSNNFTPIIKTKPQLTQWGQWIYLKDGLDLSILRILVKSELKLWGKIRGFLYKTEPYYVDYLMEDGRGFTFRCIPSIAKNGIWVNPFLRFPNFEFSEETPSAIRFRCTYPELNKNDLEYQLEIFKYQEANKTKNFNSYFHKNKQPLPLLQNYKNSFHNHADSVQHLMGGEISYSYEVSLDTLWSKVTAETEFLMLETDVKYMSSSTKGIHVVSFSKSTNDFWKEAKLQNTQNSWSNSLHVILLNRNKHGKGILRTYLWNLGENPLYVDYLRVKIRGITTTQ